MKDKILKIIADILEVDESELTLSTRREDVDEWDSLAHLQIIAELEEKGIKFHIDDIANINTIDDFIKFAEK